MSKKKEFPSYRVSQVIDDLIQDPIFLDEIKQYASSINAPESELISKSKKIFKEVISRYQKRSLLFSRLCMKTFSSTFFSNIKIYGDTASLQNSEYEYLYLPSHRSHVDYLFISYILFSMNLAPPHIAAGINLAFFPMGPIFRRLGAFFIRRRISGNFLYLQCLKAYLRWLTHYPVGIELFIEGGRSRDGKIRKPQTGILQMIFESFGTKFTKPYKVVPVSISYDFTPEVFSYEREEHGKQKKKETFFTLLQSCTRLEKYHDFHIYFSTPIDAKEWIEQHGSDKSSILKLATNVMDTIQQTMVVTPYHIMACAITSLNQPLFEDDLYQSCLQIKNHLRSMDVTFSHEAENLEKSFPYVVEGIIKKGWISRQPGYCYTISVKHAVIINYYKYSILHFFVPTLLSCLKGQNVEMGKDLIHHEFPVLSSHLRSPTPPTETKPIIIEIAKSIFSPYIEVIKALHKESLDKIVHSLSINPEKELEEEAPNLTYQKIKHAYDFLHRMEKSQLVEIEKMLETLLLQQHHDA